MLRNTGYLLVFLIAILFLTGCELIGGVIEFTLWTVIIILAIIIAVIWLLVKAFRRRV